MANSPRMSETERRRRDAENRYFNRPGESSGYADNRPYSGFDGPGRYSADPYEDGYPESYDHPGAAGRFGPLPMGPLATGVGPYPLGMPRYHHPHAYGRRSRYGTMPPAGHRHYDHDHERNFWDQAGDEVQSWFGDEDAARRREQDHREGEHRGRGPKSYARSDSRIYEDVCDRLYDDTWIDASQVEVSVDKGEVTLSGHVHSKPDRRAVEDIADGVSGVGHVQNNMRVITHDHTDQQPHKDTTRVEH